MDRKNLYEAEIYLDKPTGTWVMDLQLSKEAVQFLFENRSANAVNFQPCEVFRGNANPPKIETYWDIKKQRCYLPKVEGEETPATSDRCAWRYRPTNGLKHWIAAMLLKKSDVDRKTRRRKMVIGAYMDSKFANDIVRLYLDHFKKQASPQDVVYKTKFAVEMEEG